MPLWIWIVLLAGLIKLPLAGLMLWMPFRNDEAMRAPEHPGLLRRGRWLRGAARRPAGPPPAHAAPPHAPRRGPHGSRRSRRLRRARVRAKRARHAGRPLTR